MERIRLTIDVPSSVDRRELSVALFSLGLNREGITLVTPQGVHFDVDLVNVERLVLEPDGTS